MYLLCKRILRGKFERKSLVKVDERKRLKLKKDEIRLLSPIPIL